MSRIGKNSRGVAEVLLALLAIAFAVAAPLRAQQPEVLRLPWDQWQGHAGDDPRCAAMSDPACTWEDVITDAGMIDGWSRIESMLPAELRKPQQLGLLIQGEEPVYEVFVNGVDIGSSGSLKTRRGPQFARAIFLFPSSLAPDGKLVVAIHTLGIPTANYVGNFDPAVAPIGEIQTVMDEDTLAYLSSSWQHYLCYAALGGAALVFFLLFAVNTKLREYLWLGMFLSVLPILRLGELGLVLNIGMPSWLALVLYDGCNGLSPLIVIEFIFAFLGRPVPKIFRAVQLLGAVELLRLVELLPLPMALFLPLVRFGQSNGLHTVLIGSMLLAHASFLLLLPVCFKSKLPEMRWIGGAILFFVFVEVNRQAHNVRLSNIPQSFMWGPLDFDLRPVAYLIFALVMLIAMTFRLRRIQDRNREVEQEMAAARSIQQILIPNEVPSIPGLTVESAYLPAQEVGGDFFQVLPLEQNSEADRPSAFIVLGDVSGKGLKAAMTVSLIVGTLRASAPKCSGPGALLAEVNRCLCGRSDGFTTCLAMMISPSGKVTIANAGHPSPYLNGVEIATDNNLPLGLSLDVRYGEICFELEPGQRLALVTDGVVEATHAHSRELFGFERTQAVSARSAGEIAEAARNFGVGAPQADDITVLTIGRTVARKSQLREAMA